MRRHEVVATRRRNTFVCRSACRARLAEALAWLDANLPKPSRFNRSTSKGAYRRETAGLSWLKDTAHEAIAHMRTIAKSLSATGQPVTMLTTDRPGYVVYEDELQIVAEPFADTTN